MNSFTYSYPTKVFFGNGSVEQALKGFGDSMGKNVMIVIGGGSVKRNGILESIEKILKSMGKNITLFEGIMPNPTYEKVQEGAALAKANGIDFIIAIGGGSVIDASKIISVQALTNEDIYDLEYSFHIIPQKGIPIGAIVTVSGTGAEMNGGAVVTIEDKKLKCPLFSTQASFAALDPEYTLSVPRQQVFSGAFDTLSHAMETYFGSSDENNPSDDAALAIMRNTVVNMSRLFVDINDNRARGNLMWDSAMAENGILKCGRLTDFQAHQIEHQLGAYTDCNHGEGLAVIQPVYYSHILNDAREKFTKFARFVFNAKNAEEGLAALKEFIAQCGLPTKLSQLKVKTPITKELLKAVADSTNIIKTNPRTLNAKEIYEILEECM